MHTGVTSVYYQAGKGLRRVVSSNGESGINHRDARRQRCSIFLSEIFPVVPHFAMLTPSSRLPRGCERSLVVNSKEKQMLIRRKVEFYRDPYLEDLKPGGVAVCQECRSVYYGHRWALESQGAREIEKAKHVVETLCPACRKIRDRMPGGIVTLSGGFLRQHEQEIVNLLNHENREAMETNPLERIMSMEWRDESLVIETTNEKLAQKLGRAVHKAYSGRVEYKWSDDTKLVRVNWRRD